MVMMNKMKGETLMVSQSQSRPKETATDTDNTGRYDADQTSPERMMMAAKRKSREETTY
jgi:hypothetical protein